MYAYPYYSAARRCPTCTDAWSHQNFTNTLRQAHPRRECVISVAGEVHIHDQLPAPPSLPPPPPPPLPLPLPLPSPLDDQPPTTTIKTIRTQFVSDSREVLQEEVPRGSSQGTNWEFSRDIPLNIPVFLMPFHSHHHPLYLHTMPPSSQPSSIEAAAR